MINEGIGADCAGNRHRARWATWRRCSSTRPPSSPAGILVTEGCRGDGGLLRDVDGHRFMPDYEPEKKELASRDVVSRRMEAHIRSRQGRRNALWRAPVAGHHPARRSAHRTQAARGEGNLPALPRHRPGGAVDTGAPGPALLDGRHPHRRPRPGLRLRGLFACGEAACWDLHGFNRLGGNSVAETVVAGMIVGEAIADFCASPDGDMQVSTALVRETYGQRAPNSPPSPTTVPARTPTSCCCAPCKP